MFGLVTLRGPLSLTAGIMLCCLGMVWVAPAHAGPGGPLIHFPGSCRTPEADVDTPATGTVRNEDPSRPDSIGVGVLSDSFGRKTATQVMVASAASNDDDEKKRVPKEKEKEKTNGKRSDGRHHHEAEADEGESCWGSCFGDFLTGLFFSGEGDEDEEVIVPEASGIQESAAADTAEESEPPPPVAFMPVEEVVELPPPRSRFALLSFLGWGKNGPSTVSEEYGGGAVRFGLTGLWATASSFQVGLTLGYAAGSGDPKFNYETTSRRDSPTGSNVYVFDAAVRAGQYLRIGGKDTRLYWGVGPALFWVKERADLEVYTLPDEKYVGKERVSLEKWRVGGDAAVGMDWSIGNSGARLGFLTRFFVIPWTSEGKKSLTLDFIGKRSIVGFNLGLAAGFDGF
jgi:hypothetical protein